MDISRRKFIGKSLLLGSSVSFAGYVLSKHSPPVPVMNHPIDGTVNATYKNTKHNRQFYASTRF